MSLTVSALFAATVVVGSLLFMVSCKEDEKCPTPCECRREGPDARLIIDCKRKGLTTIPDISGLQDTVIHRFFLDGNRIADIFSQQFKGFAIQGLQFSDNPIMEIADDAFDGLDESLEFLSLQRTELWEVPTAALSSLHKLVVLDMSGVAPLMTLRAHDFTGLASLEELVLKGVMLIDVHPDAFAGLTRLNILRMESCGLSTIPDSIRHLTALRYIHLDQNSIDNVPNYMFRELPALRTITLSANRLADGQRHLPENAFGGLRFLTELDLGFNEFTVVPRQVFSSLSTLEKLRLGDNFITELHPDSFIGMDSLEELDIGGNNVIINHKVLRDVKDTLKVLHIGRTGLTWETFPGEILRNLTSLKELDLEGNRFPVLPTDAFSGIKAKSISLMYCGIEHTEPYAFRGLKAPVKVKLNWNRITNVTFVHDPCAFEKIELYRNPVHCDCAFRQMANYNHIQWIGHCATPEEFGGHEITRYVSGVQGYCNSSTPHSPVGICDWYASAYSTEDTSSSSIASPSLAAINVLILLSLCFIRL